MGWDYEILCWQPTDYPGGVGDENYRDVQIWCGNSRVRAVCAFLIALPARQGRPLKLVWR